MSMVSKKSFTFFSKSPGSYSSYYIKDDNGEYRYFLKECFLNIQEERQKKLEQLGI